MEGFGSLFLSMDKLRQPYFIYLLIVSFVGICLTLWSFIQIPNNTPYAHYLLFIALALLSQVATTYAALASSQTGVLYSIVSAVSMATVVIFNPIAAILVESASILGGWLIKPRKETEWKRRWQQLLFNNGMSVIAILGSGTLFLFLRDVFASNAILAETLPWLLAAIAYDQINLWLLIGILYFQQGKAFNVREFWRENTWFTRIMLLLTSIGGATLAFAERQFGTMGILIFFLPVFLSAYAVRLYINQMEDYMKNLENIVEKRTQELVDLGHRKDQFLAILTHDMKSPLTTIKLYAEMVMEQPNILEKRPHFLQPILYGQETLVDMVNNILDLEKLESGNKIDLHKDIFELRTLAKMVMGLLQVQATKKEITMEVCDEALTPVSIEADPHQIKRVLINLVSNAVKYSPRKGHVVICVQQVDDTAVIEVTDTGYGIPEESLPYVFDRFHRVEKLKDKAAGTGLGLAICKALVEAHEGQITVASEEGKGSTFTVMLPTSTLPVPNEID